MSISLVAGLGNPGSEYAATRHNLGWIVIEAFAQKLGLAWKKQSQFNAEVAPGIAPVNRRSTSQNR
jgi:peptidyl-tRNA hydrolase, PTH1 family